MTEWRYVHGEGDDPLGAPTYVASAYGVKFDPPVSQTEMGRMIGTLGNAVRLYVEQMITANDQLSAAVPEDESQKALAGKLMEQILKEHQKETGATFVFKSGESQQTKTPEVDVSEHKSLAEKYGAYLGAMNEKDLNRAFLVRCCEDYVLGLDKTANSRIQIRVTLRDLLEEATKELPFMAGFLSDALLPTLISDGWVLFNHDEETRLLPYGKGLPSYDASKCAMDHPMWSRNIDDPWVV